MTEKDIQLGLPLPLFLKMFLPPNPLSSPHPSACPRHQHTKPCIHLLGAAVFQLGQNGHINIFLRFLLGKSLREK